MRQWAWIAALLGITLAAVGCAKQETGPAKLKIGFVIKQPDEQWFQVEWMFAQKAADENGFELVKLPARDAEQVYSAINSMAAQGVKGFVICTPDPRLGPSILKKATDAGMKVMTVDDQFVDADGKIMKDVPHLGMSPKDMGMNAAKAELDEMKKRGWTVGDTAVMVSSFEELDTAKQRTDGAQETLIAAGFPKAKLYDAPNKKTDVPSSMAAGDACLSRHQDVKHWLIVGMNEAAVLGAVRATEQHQIAPENVIGVGINGTDCDDEFAKPGMTGFVGSILPEPNKHGYETTMMMYKWVKDGTEPPHETLMKKGTLLTRENYKQAKKDQGMSKE